MWQKVAVMVAKYVGKKVKTDERWRDGLGAIILAPLVPIIIIILIICMLASAVAQYNSRAMSFLFGGAALPWFLPPSVTAYYNGMSAMLGKLIGAWSGIISFGEAEDEEEDGEEEDDECDDEDEEDSPHYYRTDLSERELLMKLSFYSLYSDKTEDDFTDEDYLKFATAFADGETVNDIYNELREEDGIDIDEVGKDTIIDLWNHSYSYVIDWDEEGTRLDWGGWNDGKITRTVFFEEGEIGEMVVQYAMTRLGDPYSPQLRGQGNYGDCSYLTMWAYAQVGITIPPVEGPQAQAIYDAGLEISYDQLQPGDLVFWSYKPWNSFRSITHTGIYAGDGMVIHASSGQKKVVLVPLFDKDKIKMYGRPY